MERTGGRPDLTYVRGETRLAISSRLAALPSQATAYVLRFGPSSRSTTSVIPYQFTTAATFGSPFFGSFGGHSRSRPALSGVNPVIKARWPPAESPEATILDGSRW